MTDGGCRDQSEQWGRGEGPDCRERQRINHERLLAAWMWSSKVKYYAPTGFRQSPLNYLEEWRALGGC